MNIIGIGIDIEEVFRFRKLPYKKNKNFYAKIFTADEIKYCLAKPDPYPHFCARFSAKEAVIKAMPKPVHPKDIEILFRNAKISARIKNRASPNIFVSISHSRKYSTAVALFAK